MLKGHWHAIRLLVALVPAICCAGTVTLSGYLNDAGNTALIGSPAWVGSIPPAPLFADDYDIANNVALYTLPVAIAGSVNFLSKGFAAGGVDPYFSLFSGTGASATFVGSNYLQAFSTGGDFNLSFVLGVGDYTVALGAFANQPFAENNPDLDPALGDGFIGLGVPAFLGNAYYELDITRLETPVPEPSHLVVVGLAGLVMLCRQRKVFR